MTDDEKRELVAKAREWRKKQLPRSPFGDGHVVNRLADALEGALTEPEWEYGTAHRATPMYGDREYSREVAEERVREWNETTQAERGLLVRRRKAGPWEVVTDE